MLRAAALRQLQLARPQAARAASRAFPAAAVLSQHFATQTSKNPEELLHALDKIQKESASKTVRWFLDNMPPAYFRAIDEEDRLQHLNAIAALVNAQHPEVLLQSPDRKVFSHIRSGRNYPGRLAAVLDQLPMHVDGAELARVKIFTAVDDSLGLDVFRFGRQQPFMGESAEERTARDAIQSLCAEIQKGSFAGQPGYPSPAAYFAPEQVDAFLANCNSMYVQFSSPRRVALQMALYHEVQGTEGVVVDVEHGWETKRDENKLAPCGGVGEGDAAASRSTSSRSSRDGSVPQSMLTIAASNVLAKGFMQKAATYLGLNQLNVVRAHLDVVRDPTNSSTHSPGFAGGNGHSGGQVAMVRILVQPSKEALASGRAFEWRKITGNLKYLKWVDDRPVKLTLQRPELGLTRAEVIHAYGNMLHGVLAKKDPFAYSLPRIMETLEHEGNLPLAAKVADLFTRKFDPAEAPLTAAEQAERVAALKVEIRQNVEAEDAILLLHAMVDAVAGTLRTNKYVRDRYALALRLDPSVMGYGTVGRDAPFGVFFVYGRRFKGFHVRFRDIARGGLRVVYPGSKDAHALESARQFNEAYNLAFAQQLKNKDIPEGGSKAVVLCDPIVGPVGDLAPRDFIIRKSVKAFSDALLDLNTADAAVRRAVVDYYGREELLYLGPDENITPEDITWMTKRAAYRQYPIPRAFISSKPDAGINHKVYGVTSEGVAVFADVALRSTGIDPTRDAFTVKITGGTDGDVAGNVIRILHREYGSNVRVVGICDGTGVAEDPAGLDMDELLRLVRESLPLSALDTSTLSPTGVFRDVSTQEGVRARNSMHNRVRSDLFIPAGGRPNTINENNWREFVATETDAEGRARAVPASPLIVEGANLFITPEARQLLFDEAGVVIVKDSSANKCGVVCSSYEIMASMLLDTPEFLKVKQELVRDVLAKLRQLARVEAQLLFREYKKDPGAALPPSSERISRAITRVHDAVLASYDEFARESAEDERELLSLVDEHLPRTLREVAAGRVHDRVPRAYVKCIVAAGLASKIVYREGLQFAEALPDASLARVALQYLKQEKRVGRLADQLRASDVQDKDEIADLLVRGGVRAGIDTPH